MPCFTVPALGSYFALFILSCSVLTTIGDHFCPIVTRSQSKVNRAYRMRCNKTKAAAIQGLLFYNILFFSQVTCVTLFENQILVFYTPLYSFVHPIFVTHLYSPLLNLCRSYLSAAFNGIYPFIS